MTVAAQFLFAEQSAAEAAALLRRAGACFTQRGADVTAGFVDELGAQAAALDALGARLREARGRSVIPVQ